MDFSAALQRSCQMKPASFARAKALSKGVGFSCLHAAGPGEDLWLPAAKGRRPPVLISAYCYPSVLD